MYLVGQNSYKIFHHTKINQAKWDINNGAMWNSTPYTQKAYAPVLQFSFEVGDSGLGGGGGGMIQGD